jgi:hypothetical protein
MPWYYQMTGNLDGARLKCSARAHLRKEKNCWRWRLTDVRCDGEPDADWIHDAPDDTEDELRYQRAVCLEGTWWGLEYGLPGNGSCASTVEEEGGRLRRLEFKCEWACRGGGCVGEGHYRFQPQPVRR